MLLILTQRVVEFLADAVLLLVSSAFLTGPVKSQDGNCPGDVLNLHFFAWKGLACRLISSKRVI